MQNHKTRLPDSLSAAVKSVLEKDTPAKIAKRWGMSRDTLARALAGYEINRGTVAEIKLGLMQDGVTI